MKKIALINDLSGFGKCSLTAAIPVISVMGIQACPFPTAVLSSQTGFQNYICCDFTEHMNRFTDHWEQMEVSFDGIYSGYLAGEQQIEKVEYFLEKFRKEDTIYLADPVMGDHGEFYSMFRKEFMQKMKALTMKADVVTPNLTELCMLTEKDYKEITSYYKETNYIDIIHGVCKKLLAQSERQQTVVVTGILREKDGKEYVGNLAVSEKESFYMENLYTGLGFSGTGDLFASVICGSLVKGENIFGAVAKAAYFLQDAIEEATREKSPTAHGVCFEKYLSRLL